jgi:PhnB protein
MSVTVVPHLNLRGQARAALEHYRTAFGGELAVTTYADAGAVEDPAEADHVMWGQVVAPSGFTVMAYDVPASRPWSPGEDPFFVSVRGTDVGELTACWHRLAEGATVRQPLGPAPWAAAYGMLTDRFGVTWVLDVLAA